MPSEPIPNEVPEPQPLMTKEVIEGMCNKERPDEATDTEWLDPIIKRVAESMPVKQAKREAARSMVASAEKSLLGRTNKYLRVWGKSGQWPIDWMDMSNMPLALARNHKVRLGAASPANITTAAQYQREEFAKTAQAHEETLAALTGLTREMRMNRASNPDDLFRPKDGQS